MKQILIIDDEPIIQKLITTYCKKLNITYNCATNGEEALSIFQNSQEYSLILLDLTLPDYSGETLIPLFRKIYPEIPIIISTGYTKNESISELLKNDKHCEFIQKPFNFSDFKEVIEKFIE